MKKTAQKQQAVPTDWYRKDGHNIVRFSDGKVYKSRDRITWTKIKSKR